MSFGRRRRSFWPASRPFSNSLAAERRSRQLRVWARVRSSEKALKRGSTGEDVRRLQQFLATDPNIYPEAQITGYYGALTEAAVKRWQVKFNIVSSGTPETTGYGVVGPRTAAAIALQCTGTSPSGGTPGTPSVGGFIQVTPIAGNAPLSVAVQATVNTVNSCNGAVYTLDYGDGTVPSQIAVPAGNCQQMTQTLGHSYPLRRYIPDHTFRGRAPHIGDRRRVRSNRRKSDANSNSNPNPGPAGAERFDIGLRYLGCCPAQYKLLRLVCRRHRVQRCLR